MVVYNVSQRISTRMLKCSKQILLRKLSPIVCSTSVSSHGWQAFHELDSQAFPSFPSWSWSWTHNWPQCTRKYLLRTFQHACTNLVGWRYKQPLNLKLNWPLHLSCTWKWSQDDFETSCNFAYLCNEMYIKTFSTAYCTKEHKNLDKLKFIFIHLLI